MLFTQGEIEVKPSGVGYDESRIEVLKNHFQSLINAGEIQCAMYCIARHGKVFAHGAVGKKSFRAEDTTPAAPTDLRWYASITKVITATAIMKLVEDGKLRLNSSVGEFLPQLNTPPFNAITILHLLSHTSGLYADDGCFENKYQTNYWGLIKDAAARYEKKDGEFDWIAAAMNVVGSGVRTKLGEEWAYCTFGYVLLGAVIEKITGVHAHDYIMENIAKPLNMADSCFGDDMTPSLAKRCAITYESSEKEVQEIVDGTRKLSKWDLLKIPSTGGGMSGTVRDLVSFGNMFLGYGNERVLGRKGREAMFKTRFHDLPNFCWGAGGAPRSYCAGFDLRLDVLSLASESAISHEGAEGAALYIDPDEDMVIAWFAPFVDSAIGWFPNAMYNTTNVIFSGLE
ncbi:MAG: beta-lactamase family protein [Defluviitaleaceae bacterium]|nr:beta-lactamase family protein [Defluviitaleaceae bacterium]MCL2262138.1 beta-lactamase family protein [Defluviitaleaceae bacterium]